MTDEQGNAGPFRFDAQPLWKTGGMKPSRAFLIHQSVLNALDLERLEYGFHGTVQAYARQRFGHLPAERWSGVYGFAQMVRTCFRTLAAQYPQENT